MLRAGLIRKSPAAYTAGCPWAIKFSEKITNIVREEMDKSGAMEVSMPIVQPAELWQESERWSQMGPELPLEFKIDIKEISALDQLTKK